MNKYELLYTLPAKYTEEEVGALKEKITNELTGLGLSISRDEEVGKIKLAYPMKRTRYGHYILVNFESEPTAISKINETLRLHPDILRHQIVKPEAGARPFAALADPEAREYRSREVAAAAIPAPSVSAPIPAGPAMSEEELEKKLTALEEDITKSL